MNELALDISLIEGTRPTEQPFRKSLVQENLTFYRSFWGLKSLAPQLPGGREL